MWCHHHINCLHDSLLQGIPCLTGGHPLIYLIAAPSLTLRRFSDLASLLLTSFYCVGLKNIVHTNSLGAVNFPSTTFFLS